MTIYLVCAGTEGGHESSGVFSVWVNPLDAIAEASRLSAIFGDERIEITSTSIDASRDEPDVTWAPPNWRTLRDQWRPVTGVALNPEDTSNHAETRQRLVALIHALAHPYTGKGLEEHE